jgi:AraC family transcriptional regulator of adaptative response/methylated-DNA-[protein]-cysteine methyltransferase
MPQQLKYIDTPIGKMAAVADEHAVLSLAFADCQQIQPVPTNISQGTKAILDLLESELLSYFAGNLRKFKTPIRLLGTRFQQLAWNSLIGIPYGETKSYKEQAKVIERSSAYRAVANANGKNNLAIIVPCHRIINSSGALGGYNGEIWRKKWLLEHERSFLCLKT